MGTRTSAARPATTVGVLSPRRRRAQVRLVPQRRFTRRRSATAARNAAHRSCGRACPRPWGSVPITFYPLTGKHREVTCGDCHKTSVPRARYRGLKFSRCMVTGDQHRAIREIGFGAECKQCHATAGFRPAVRHAAPREGRVSADRQAPGDGVLRVPHEPEAAPRLTSRRRGAQTATRIPHGDQFAKEMKDGGCGLLPQALGLGMPKLTRSGADRRPLPRCELPPPPEDRKKGSGPSWKTPTACNGCHDDAHEGQFKKGEPVITGAPGAIRPRSSRFRSSITTNSRLSAHGQHA